MDWRLYESEFERVNARAKLKDGPYRFMHYDSCWCSRCCGVTLSREIKEFYMSRECDGLAREASTLLD